jgi:hypothetical protein
MLGYGGGRGLGMGLLFSVNGIWSKACIAANGDFTIEDIELLSFLQVVLASNIKEEFD